jgi:uncharacterized protein (TIGR00645 family)
MSSDIADTRAIKFIERGLFNIRWALVVLYSGLGVVLLAFIWVYLKELYQFIWKLNALSMEELKVIVLDTTDTVMIGNLIEMVATGSYHSFVSKKHGYANKSISSGGLKVKISTSIIIVATIHLLTGFMSVVINWGLIAKQLNFFAAFLIGAIVLAAIDFLHVKTELMEHDLHEKQHEAQHNQHAVQHSANTNESHTEPAASERGGLHGALGMPA